jgi:hypothetical protein
MKFLGIIPALCFYPFSGQAIGCIGGNLIQRVYEQVQPCLDEVWVVQTMKYPTSLLRSEDGRHDFRPAPKWKDRCLEAANTTEVITMS